MRADITDLVHVVALKMAMFEAAGMDHHLADNAEAIILSDYLQMYDNKTAIHFIVRDGDKIVAVAGAFIKSDIPYRYFKNPEYGFIGDVYTLPDYRGKGFAPKLVNQALDWFRDQGITEVRLLAAEKAASIYKQLGFKYNEEMVLEFKTCMAINTKRTKKVITLAS